MEEREWSFVDKSKWPQRGEWDAEPDKKQWSDPDTGLPCLIVRGPSGALCGYVGLPSEHRFHGMDYDHVGGDIDVHGGLTFAGSCQEAEDGICHVPSPGEPDNVWWLGFDCAHLWDLTPAYGRDCTGDTYRAIPYVMRECRKLAKQLAP